MFHKVCGIRELKVNAILRRHGSTSIVPLVGTFIHFRPNCSPHRMPVGCHQPAQWCVPRRRCGTGKGSSSRLVGVVLPSSGPPAPHRRDEQVPLPLFWKSDWTAATRGKEGGAREPGLIGGRLRHYDALKIDIHLQPEPEEIGCARRSRFPVSPRIHRYDLQASILDKREPTYISHQGGKVCLACLRVFVVGCPLRRAFLNTSGKRSS